MANPTITLPFSLYVSKMKKVLTFLILLCLTQNHGNALVVTSIVSVRHPQNMNFSKRVWKKLKIFIVLPSNFSSKKNEKVKFIIFRGVRPSGRKWQTEFPIQFFHLHFSVLRHPRDCLAPPRGTRPIIPKITIMPRFCD